METERELLRQTEKMLKDIKTKRKDMRLVDESKKNLVKNLDAYISDTQHFIDKKDFIRAYEAIVYAWGILETMEMAGIVELCD
ncbi:DUF357 domain-containing protein [archaeon]|nr:DUF357 domain-containing protein [archaeon]